MKNLTTYSAQIVIHLDLVLEKNLTKEEIKAAFQEYLQGVACSNDGAEILANGDIVNVYEL